MTDTPRTDEAFASCSTLTLLICSRELETENAKLKYAIRNSEAWADEYCIVCHCHTHDGHAVGCLMEKPND